ncbi:MAG: cytochrome b, partial [Alphaproteobacteria bacterium]
MAKTLHWLIAVLIFAMLAIGFYAAEVLGLRSAEGFQWIQRHKSLGIVVLALVLVRLVWRLHGPVPPIPVHVRPWERAAARVVHFTLYVLMLAMPLTGWALISTSASNLKTEIFGLFVLPPLLPPDRALHDLFEEVHESLAFALIAVVAVHVAAALFSIIINLILIPRYGALGAGIGTAT